MKHGKLFKQRGGKHMISYTLTGVYKIGPFQSSSRGSRNFIQNSVPISTKNHPEGSRGHFTIDNLLPNSTCQFRLAASNVKGYGPEIIWVTHTMPSKTTCTLSLNSSFTLVQKHFFYLLQKIASTLKKPQLKPFLNRRHRIGPILT